MSKQKKNQERRDKSRGLQGDEREKTNTTPEYECVPRSIRTSWVRLVFNRRGVRKCK